jgi:hypothetical protein
MACHTAGVQAIKGKTLRQTAIAKPRIGSEHIQPKGKVFVANFRHAVFEKVEANNHRQHGDGVTPKKLAVTERFRGTSATDDGKVTRITETPIARHREIEFM